MTASDEDNVSHETTLSFLLYEHSQRAGLVVHVAAISRTTALKALEIAATMETSTASGQRSLG